MKRGFKYKMMVLIFGGYLLAFAVWVIGAIVTGAITFSMLLIGFISLLAISFISCLITAKMVKPLANLPGVHRKLSSFVENISTLLKEIENSSNEIDYLTNTINDIRFQAQLLALNTTIEATRAGEAGRGFTAIASEIKNLAQRTSESTKAIQALVTQNVASAKKGLELVNESSAFFSVVVKMINELALKSDKISEPVKL
jgi:prefoldin subunit 5